MTPFFHPIKQDLSFGAHRIALRIHWFIAGLVYATVQLVLATSPKQGDAEHSIQVGRFRIPEEPTVILRDIGGYAAVFKSSKRSNQKDIIYEIVSPSSNYIDSGVVALIKSHAGKDLGPVMPQLQASLKEIPRELMVSWRFDLEYPRPNERSFTDDEIHIPKNISEFVELAANEPWKLFKSYKDERFFGGNATLTFRIHTADNQGPKDPFQYRFRIGGQNPPEDLVTAYIKRATAAIAVGKKKVHPLMWYSTAIAKHETRGEEGKKPGKDGTKPPLYYHQFLQNGYKYDLAHPPENAETYKPNWNFDYLKRNKKPSAGGFGIFQVTGNSEDSDADVPREVIWNWQANIDAGLRILRSKQIAGADWLARQKNMEPNEPPVPAVVIRVERLKKMRDIVFVDNTPRTILDLLTIKGYNGSSWPKTELSWVDPDPEPEPKSFGYTGEHPTEGYYVYWCKRKHKWCLSRYSCDKRNYVDLVCKEVEQ